MRHPKQARKRRIIIAIYLSVIKFVIVKLIFITYKKPEIYINKSKYCLIILVN